MPTPLLRRLLSITEVAAATIRDIYAKGFSVAYKSPGDPVTLADTLANAQICERLRREFPDAALVAEESSPGEFAGYATAERIFFIDPLDGTREFVARSTDFVVMIGLVEGDAAHAGIIHAPISGTVWCGEVGRGAWRIDPTQTPRPIAPSQRRQLRGATLALSRSQTPTRLQRQASEAGIARVIGMGSAGLKGAAIADGTADAYVAADNAGCRWDVCAPDAILRASGAALTDAFGDAFDYRCSELANTRGLAAANAQLHARLLQWLAKLRGANA